ncbi:hypothetical protein NQV05_00160 [Mycoplasmopsis agalactiae]|uniref:hypothetical protein n=1 Tax=Mycoplasmopsis agalactiae TaxID=2110 RepID=UPI00211CCBD1|nr:hypothetical protein [Mycoplasmopsis agalactiae]UUM25560.1 hypothetical protein NQV05_00160 [Mycoplasmopsis agalactiae]
MDKNHYIKDTTSKIPIKEKINMIKTLCFIDNEMNKAKLIREKASKLFGYKDDSLSNYKSRFYGTFDYMNENNAEFIKQYFIDHNENSAKSMMSKSAYYRLRKNAIEEFVYYYITR